MTEVINFKKARKQAIREKQESVAAENRARFGRSKADKKLEAAQKQTARSFLDQRKLEREDEK
ncbi:hypothetical protein GJW-30_1_01870 [Variibacter gotjawalensis]|uniref:DUF4169 domain-containing protein n=1 Tax=Variibacter gotjawalensis TaxID=1333996 RepID=A0A0S3PTV1_9BRAD|nr:DUF4169 family protein [Variibacter gotjawalensis]NIK49656.1 hypothetical protein [Variibacter gotjawalensis]RZS45668.1 uncharacterized protein DUF4169 [Variibacter gotjawalensis]BAT59339.1 hypothetical protein GJW-30_1_01870 [Variibacter gotjawalensis]